MKLKHLSLALLCALALPVGAQTSGEGGDVEAPVNYEQTFDGPAMPGGWIIDDGFTISAGSLYNSTRSTTSDKWEMAKRAISPKMHFDAETPLRFQVKMINAYSTIMVLYSPDRSNWTKLTTITASGYGGEIGISGSSYMFKDVPDLAIPEGDYYVALDVNYSYIDNFKGGPIVPVELDVYAKSTDIPTTVEINHNFEATTTLSNLGGDIAADSYTAALYMGKVPAVAEPAEAEEAEDPAKIEFVKIADIPTVDIPQFGTATLSATYMPHDPGKYKVYIGAQFGDLEVQSKMVEMSINSESLQTSAQVGTPKSWSATNERTVAPLNLYTYYSSSQVIYTAEMLAEAGIVPGTKITGAFIRGYNPNTTSSPRYRYNMGIQSTDASVFTDNKPIEFASYQGSGYLETLPGSGSADNTLNIIDVNFDEENYFVYQGGNIVVAFTTPEDDPKNNYAGNFCYEMGDDAAGRGIQKSNDNKDSWKNASYTAVAKLPVINFRYNLEPLTVSGTVTRNGEPVADVPVKVESDGIYYTSTSDNEGKYSVGVVQTLRTYTLTAYPAEGPRYTAVEPIKFEDASIAHDIALRDWPVVSGKVTNSKGQAIAEQPISFVFDDDNTYSATTDEQGAFSMQVMNIDVAPYVMTIDNPDYRIYSADIDLNNGLDRNMDIQLEDFNRNREFKLNIKVNDVRGTSMEGIAYTLHSNVFDFDYDNTETIFTEDGSCALDIYGGKHIFTLELPGMKPINKEFDVNKNVDLTFDLFEDVRTPAEVSAALIHDAFTGKNDIKLSWAPGVAADNARARRVARSAANPVEVFVISLDGKQVGETQDYQYLIEDVTTDRHKVSVQAKYTAQESEVVECMVDASAANFVAAKYIVSTNNGVNPDGFTVRVEGAKDYSVVVADGTATIPYLPVGQYYVSLEAPYFQPFNQAVTYNAKQAIYIDLEEALNAPFNLQAEATQNEGEEHFNVVLNWNEEAGLLDSFETYDDFATGTFGDWNTINLNSAPSYPMAYGASEIIFPGASTTANPVSIAPMVFVPKATQPSMGSDVAALPYDGDKYVAFMAPDGEVADKWLISPQVKAGREFQVEFMSKAYSSLNREKLELCVSTTGKETSDFVTIAEITPSASAWAKTVESLEQYAGQDIYVAIHCVSTDGMLCMVDDFKIGRDGESTTAGIGKVLSYDVLLNDEVKGNTTATTHTLTEVPAGSHSVGVRANYASGASEITRYDLALVSGIEGVDASLTGDVITPAGIMIKRDATMKDVKALPQGIYIFRGKKVVVK